MYAQRTGQRAEHGLVTSVTGWMGRTYIALGGFVHHSSNGLLLGKYVPVLFCSFVCILVKEY